MARTAPKVATSAGRWAAIVRSITSAMAAHRPAEVATLGAVRAVDEWAREYSQDIARGLELKV